MKSLSVIVPTQGNRLPMLEKLLGSLESQSTKVDFEVLVVCNPACEQVRNQVNKFAHARYLECQTGVNRARNVGLEAAEGEWLYFLDDDCSFASENHIENFNRLANMAPEVAVWSGGYRLFDNCRHSVWSLAYALNAEFWMYEAVMRGEPKMLGGNFIVRRSQIGSIRFDEEILFGGSEESFIKQICVDNKYSFSNWLDVLHDVRINFSEFSRKAILQGRGALKVEGRLNDFRFVTDFWTFLSLKPLDLGLRIRIFLAHEIFRYYFFNFYFSVQWRNLFVVIWPFVFLRNITILFFSMYVMKVVYLVRTILWNTSWIVRKPYYFLRYQFTPESFLGRTMAKMRVIKTPA